MKRFLAVLVATLAMCGAARAEVFLSQAQIEGKSEPVAPSSSVYLAAKPVGAPYSTAANQAGVNPYAAQQQTVGVALSSAQYNALLEQKKQEEAAQAAVQSAAYNTPVNTGYTPTSSSSITDDGSSYFDPSTGMFMSKSEFAKQLWARGDDPNTLYPNMFPAAPARPGTLPAGTAKAGNVTWKTTMP